jgi:lipoate-protein ligase A
MEEARAQEVKIEEITQAFLKTDKYKERRILYFKSQIASLEEDNNTLQAEVNELKRALLVNIRSERGGRSNYEVAQSFWQSEVNKGAESDSSFSDSHKSMKHI